MNWNDIFTVLAVVITNLGTVLALYMNLDRKLDENRRETNSILQGIREEMKEFRVDMKQFQGRLERLDTEFVQHMMHLHNPSEKQKDSKCK